MYVYIKSTSKEYIYQDNINLWENKKGVNAQYFEGMNLKCSPKFGRTEFNI